jgi:glutathione synthase/RimK-type ligase-like ATP-grasp enzyme
VGVALVTTASLRHLDTDLPPLLDALAARGIDAVAVNWHDEAFDWSSVQLAVLRSPWDYTTRLGEFLDRLATIDAATNLANPLTVVRANAEKDYLLRLAAAGVPVVPTTLLRPGDEVALPDGVPFVVKPTVSVGALDTERYDPAEAGAGVAHAEALLGAGRSVLVQPYVDAIDDAGETGLVYLGDRFSHGFRKGPVLRPDAPLIDGLYREQVVTARTPAAAEREVAESVLDAVGAIAPGAVRSDLLYARVDLAPGADGPVLMELELIEPSLWLPVADGALERAAAAIAARLS